MDQYNQPPMATHDVHSEYMKKKTDLELAFKEFHQLLQDKVLEKNKSPAVKNTELDIVDKLVRATQALDQINVGAGVLALASIAMKEHLMVRDRVNELEYQLLLTKKELKELAKKMGMGSEKK